MHVYIYMRLYLYIENVRLKLPRPLFSRHELSGSAFVRNPYKSCTGLMRLHAVRPSKVLILGGARMFINKKGESSLEHLAFQTQVPRHVMRSPRC